MITSSHSAKLAVVVAQKEQLGSNGLVMSTFSISTILNVLSKLQTFFFNIYFALLEYDYWIF